MDGQQVETKVETKVEGQNNDANPGGNKGDTFQPITTQDDFDRIFTRRLARAQDRIREDVRKELQSQQSDDEKARQGQFETLATERATKIAALEGDLTKATQRLQSFEEVADKELKSAFEKLPDVLKDLAPDDSEDLLARRRWYVERAVPAMEKLKEKKTPGNNPNDPPAGDGGPKIDDITKELAATGLYRRF